MAIVTNIPTPYRIPVYELVDGPSVSLHLVYLAERESNRHWTLPATRVRSSVLRSRQLVWRGRYIHFTRGVTGLLLRLRPDVVITTGFNPPQLAAFAFCLVARVPHIAQTDGTEESEATLSRTHRSVRRFVARHTAAFVAASASGERLVQRWGAQPGQVFRSPLAVDNRRFAGTADAARSIDLLFSGQLSAVKNPLFALDVASGAAARLGRRVRIVFVGAGPLAEEVRSAAAMRPDLDVDVVGFQQQDDLPRWYQDARVFLFPTRWDPWGLVSNEAAAAGTPQIISTHAGAAGELVRDGLEGYVRPLQLDAWVDAAVALLTDEDLRRGLGAAAASRVQQYSRRAAADGLVHAVAHATARTPS